MAKKGLNSDGQQYHQYQQNEQSQLTSTHWTEKKPTAYVENPRPASGQAQQCYGVQSVKRITTLPFWFVMFNIYIFV